VAQSNGCDFGVNYGGVFKWPTEVGEILCATWVNQVGYLSGLLKWVRFCLQYGKSGWVIQWSTHKGGIVGAMWENQMGCLSGPLKWV